MIPMIYEGGGRFVTETPYHAKRCDKIYGAGQSVLLEEVTEDRNMASHNHYFARLTELWQTLPEWIADEFASPTHLRKWSLIRTGYCTKRNMVLPTNEAAVEAATFIKQLDEYIVVEIRGRTLTVWQAYSQSIKAMGNKAFQKSKADVLAYAEKLVATPKPPEDVVVPFAVGPSS